jgi:hypothetical protein
MLNFSRSYQGGIILFGRLLRHTTPFIARLTRACLDFEVKDAPPQAVEDPRVQNPDTLFRRHAMNYFCWVGLARPAGKPSLRLDAWAPGEVVGPHIDRNRRQKQQGAEPE